MQSRAEQARRAAPEAYPAHTAQRMMARIESDFHETSVHRRFTIPTIAPVEGDNQVFVHW